MEIVKKNLISIICGVVALAALVVGLFMVPGRAGELQAKVDERKAAHDQLAELLNKPRQLPVVNPDNPAAENLQQFPSQSIITQGDEITKRVEAESKAILEAAVKMNAHKVADGLPPSALPSPGDPDRFTFREWYRGVLPPLVAGAAEGGGSRGGSGQSRFAKDLKAGMPPMPEDVRVKQDQLAAEIRQKKTYFLPDGQPANQQLVDDEIKAATAKLPQDLRDGVANNSRLYVNHDTFEVNPAIFAAVGAPDVVNIYFAHLSYWIQQDVVAAINEINANSKRVQDSPVKYLVRIRSKPMQQSTGGAGTPTFITGPEMTAAGDANAPLPKVPAAGATGRVSNGLYDVFHFEIEAVVEADKVGDFLRGLSNKRFITPLQVDVRARDNAVALAEGHVYGDKPVVTVRADCEILYLRQWNVPLMPMAVRTRLGVPADQPATPAATPADGAAPAAQPAAATEQPAAAAQ